VIVIYANTINCKSAVMNIFQTTLIAY